MQIPWLFPDFSQYSFFSLTFNKIPWLFPDFCQVWNFPDFSLTTGHPVDGSTNTGGRRSVSHSPMPCDLVTWQSIKEWPKLGLGSSLAFWVVETVDGAITSAWLVVLSQKSIDALNSYGQLLFDKDITLTIVLFITILQNKQNASCFVTIDSWNSRRIDIIVEATKSFRFRGRDNVIDGNFV